MSAKNDNKEFWNKFARFYGFFMKKINKIYMEMSVSIAKLINKDMNVLELACGSGQLSFLLADKVNNYTATDFSPEMIEQACLKNKKINMASLCFDIQDATSLEYNDESFDALLISNAMHVVPDPEAVMNEVRRVLKPGGLLFAPTFVWGDKLGNKINLWFLKKIGFEIFNLWSEEEYIDFLKKYSFELLEHKVFGSKLSPLCYVALKKI